MSIRVDTTIGDDRGAGSLESLAQQISEADSLELDAAWSSEVKHDPFLPLLVAAQQSSRLSIGTAIAVAFARSPMTLANTAYDLQNLSGGRFVLGLGSQIKPHIERRFHMPWSAPADRMREYVQALHAIWDSWDTGDPLDFRGDFYQHTLMTPMFSPGRNPHGKPPVFLAAVGERMAQVAADVADGLIVHSFNTPRYLREVTAPMIDNGLRARGVDRTAFQVYGPIFVATGATGEELQSSIQALRKRIAFYGSTPAYRPVLTLHGWDELHVALNRLSKQGEWDAMADLIDDDVLNTFGVCGPIDTIGAEIATRYRGLLDRVSVFSQLPLSQSVHAQIVSDIRRSEDDLTRENTV